MVKNLWLGLEKSLFFPSGSRAVVVVDVADALLLVSLPPHRSLLGRTLILCDLSRVEHEALYVSAQGTSPAEASRARGNTPNRPLGIIGGSKRSRFFPPFFRSFSFLFLFFSTSSTFFSCNRQSPRLARPCRQGPRPDPEGRQAGQEEAPQGQFLVFFVS